MTKMCIRVTGILAAVVLGAAPAAAQYVPPAPPPVFAAEPGPVPGPEFCPDVPAPVLSRTPFVPLTEFKTGFDEPCGDPERLYMVYWGAGAITLQRQRPSNGVVAVQDQTFAGDVGGTLPIGAPALARFSSIDDSFHWGVQGRWGIQWGCHNVEAYGFYIPDQADTATIGTAGALDVLFGGYPAPAGFGGVNNLWLQADQLNLRMSNRLINAEVNYRYTYVPGLALLAGVRYINFEEEYSILTSDNPAGAPYDPTLAANYQVNSDNQIYGGQIGCETEYFLDTHVGIGLVTKGMVGADSFQVRNQLTRGDGFQRTPGTRDGTQVSGLVELNAFLHIAPNEHIRFRTGYRIFWLLNVPVAFEQVNFDPNVVQGSPDDNGSVFFHGPALELQLAF